jgi:anti-sigma B factor antagonist
VSFFRDEDIDATTQLIEVGVEGDVYTPAMFRDRLDRLIDSGKRDFLLDVSHWTFVDAAVDPITILLKRLKRLRPAGGSITLICTDENFREIFQITGLDRVISIHLSREEALAALGSLSQSASPDVPMPGGCSTRRMGTSRMSDSTADHPYEPPSLPWWPPGSPCVICGIDHEEEPRGSEP